MADDRQAGRHRSLIVALPSLAKDSGAWEALRDALNERGLLAEESDWLIYDHHIGRLSRLRLQDVTRDLEATIAGQWRANGGYDEITLVGHSVGALLVRKAWLNCVDPDQGDEFTGRAWGRRVKRFVLFAGVSRGIDTETLPLFMRLATRLFEALPGTFSVEDMFRGSKFITDLRISWIRHFARLAPEERPTTVQLLGTHDTMVGRDDSIDLAAFPDNPAWNVPGAKHADLHRVEQLRNPLPRLQLIADALQHVQKPDPSPVARPEAKKVLMIVHGIRASRVDDWVQRARTRAQERWSDVEVVTPTYGYLSALRFALPSFRRRYARFFRDFYTETVSRHRRASISVLSHSNGTYALGRCLHDFGSIRLQRVVVAGSVLPSNFQWTPLIDGRRVMGVRSDGGHLDWPVAIMCSLLRGLGMRDVGTGGFDGFMESGLTEDVRYHRGGHDAMLSERNIDSMLSFLFEGTPAARTDEMVDDSPWMRRLSRAAGYAGLLVAASITLLIAWLAQGHHWGALVAVLIGLALFLFAADIA